MWHFSRWLLIFIPGLVALTFAQHQAPTYAEGELLIQLRPQAEVTEVTADFTALDLRPAKLLSRRMNIWLVRFDPARADAAAALVQVKQHRQVQLAQFNHHVTRRGAEAVPNDPMFASQWALNNTGQTGGVADADIDAPEAWDIATGGTTASGDEIVVAVIDGGADLNHEDLDYWKNLEEIPNNGIDDDNNGYVDDYDGWNAYNSNGNIPGDSHGTHVSGIAGARGNNGIGVSGVNWDVKIMPVAGSSNNEAIVVEAYGYVLEQRARYNETNGASGAFVVVTNSSFGVDFGDPNDFPLWSAMYDSMGVQGILSCGATANLNINIDISGDVPTACPSDYLIAVTNTTSSDLKNSGAAYGLTTIDLGAPGTGILNTLPGNNYGNLTGTSMATPTVAGAVALLYAAAGPALMNAVKSNPAQTALLFKEWIMAGTDSIPALQGITVTGGRLNVYNSLLLVKTFADSLDPNSPDSVTAYSDYTTPTSIDLAWNDPISFAGGDTLLPAQFTIEIARDGAWIASVPGGMMQYNDSGLNDGQPYNYEVYTKVTATDSTSGIIEVAWTAGGSPIPAGPANLAAVGDTAQAVLTWDDPTTQSDGTPLDDLAQIYIYRDGARIDSVDPGVQTYSDVPPPGFIYHYTVTAVDNEAPSNESEPSNPVSCFVGGTPEVLVWVGPDASGESAASGDSIYAALAANGKSTYLTNDLFEFGSDLSIFKAVFVVLGIFSNNHVIGSSDPEGPALQAYLQSGGSLYLEGGDCFNYDPETGGYNIRPWFGLNDGPDGSGDVAAITGLNDLSAFTFAYDGENNWMDELIPNSALPVWQNSSNSDLSGVYHTGFGSGLALGVVPSFGGLIDAPGTPLYPGRRYAEKITRHSGMSSTKMRAPRTVSQPFVKKAAYYPALKNNRKTPGELYRITPGGGLEMLANTKTDLMAAYLELLGIDLPTALISLSPDAFSHALALGDSISDTLTITHLGAIGSNEITFSITEEPPVDWLSLAPVSDTLGSGESVPVALRFHTAGLDTGIYLTTLKVSSSDSVAPELYLPVTLEVYGVPSIASDADTLNFGGVMVGEQGQQHFQIVNHGSGDLLVSSIFSTAPVFQADPTQSTVSPGDSIEVMVTFSPDSVGNFEGILKITANDPMIDTLMVYLQGSGEPVLGITSDQLPREFALSANYPNPFNPSTTIAYQLPQSVPVTLTVYNLLGQRVRRLVQGVLAPGYYRAVWNGRNDAGVAVGSGIYIYRFEAGDYRQVRKMILLK